MKKYGTPQRMQRTANVIHARQLIEVLALSASNKVARVTQTGAEARLARRCVRSIHTLEAEFGAVRLQPNARAFLATERVPSRYARR
jgi:hypothetical protein